MGYNTNNDPKHKKITQRQWTGIPLGMSGKIPQKDFYGYKWRNTEGNMFGIGKKIWVKIFRDRNR